MDEKDEAVGYRDETGREAAERVMSALYPEVHISAADPEIGAVSGFAHYSPEWEHKGAPGWVHGGLTATVVDFVSARIAKAALDSSVATGTLEIRYRQPLLMDGGPFKVEAVTEKRYSRSVRVNTRVLGREGQTLVEANALFVAVTRD